MLHHDHAPSGDQVRIRFSRDELAHIGLAVAFLTVAFTLVLNDPGGFGPRDMLARFQAPWTAYVASLIAVSSGFVLHELGHKVLAQRYGFWAEFRGQFSGLVMSLVIAAGTGFLFAAPGAVLIWGRVNAKQNALISLMGPGINFVIALLALPFTFVVDRDAFLPHTMAVVAQVNALLCVFNMLPIWTLDGRKIWYWSRLLYLSTMALAVALLVTVFVLVGQIR